MRGLRLMVMTMMASLLVGACKRTPSPGSQDQGNDAVDLPLLLAAHNLARELGARGGAQVQAQTRFEVKPAQASDKLRGEQSITTDTQLSLNAKGHYVLREENDQDGGREVHYTGDQMAVKLRYGKLIKRDARAPEPQRILEQALGGPAAFWEIFGPAAHVTSGANEPGGERRLSIGLRSAPASNEPPAPVAGEASPLAAWRRTAVPSALEGEIRYLPATDKTGPVLVAAKLSGQFSARAAKGQVMGKVEVSWAASSWGKVPTIEMPEEAEDLRLGQRTILEERALLQGMPSVKPSPPRQ